MPWEENSAAYEYVYTKVMGEMPKYFEAGLTYIKEHGMSLAGAANDLISPAENGRLYLYFPVKRL